MDAAFLCSKYSLPLFEKNNGGRIIMITSIQGIRGYKGSLAYNTAKGGLINMTRVLAVELAEKNILVNSVAPGFINTPMTSNFKKNFLWSSPSKAALKIVKAINSKKDEIYVPSYWYIIMIFIKLIPNYFFKKLNL